jgi:deazaflavin-dependent oxidoreductase (nitroreductase family)
MTRKEGAQTPLPREQPRVRALPGQRLVNLVVRGLLRTPGLCSLIGSRLLTLYLVGRKSGRRYPVPVAYLADGDDLLLGTSARWRHNLRAGQPVAVRLRGKHRWADVTTYTTESDVVSAYARMARSNPTFAKLNSIRLSDDGEPDNSDLRLAWLGGARAIRLTPR